MSKKAKVNGPCPHKTKIEACGIKVCMDCGEPLSPLAKELSKVARGVVV